jgi:hypothetical protein
VRHFHRVKNQFTVIHRTAFMTGSIDDGRTLNLEANSSRGEKNEVRSLSDLVERNAFFYQHDRNIFTDWIEDFSIGPDQPAIE